MRTFVLLSFWKLCNVLEVLGIFCQEAAKVKRLVLFAMLSRLDSELSAH